MMITLRRRLVMIGGKDQDQDEEEDGEDSDNHETTMIMLNAMTLSSDNDLLNTLLRSSPLLTRRVEGFSLGS